MEVVDVQVRGTQVRIRRWGGKEGRPLFYWHGGGGGSGETPVLAPRLVAAGYALYALDAPGYGDSPPLDPEGYAPPELAGLAADLLDELVLSVAPTLVGRGPALADGEFPLRAFELVELERLGDNGVRLRFERQR